MKAKFLIASFFTLVALDGFSQYFGQNKPRYRNFDFKIKQTEHYDIYYYTSNEAIIDRLAQWSEMWYDHHYSIFRDTIGFKNPILFYNNHADFQQNNAISSALGPGTGGVTEAFKNRVVMPFTFTHQQTNHTLGHELVHAYQFNTVVRDDTTSLENLRNLPLWMSEGLAEYLSLGSEDSHTAMWMRDAVATDDIPEIKKLNNFKYFPYRYGHALWAFIAGFYGDNVIEPLYHATAAIGYKAAIDTFTQRGTDNLSNMWAESLKTYFNPLIEKRDLKPDGKVLINPDNSGNINTSPVLSPNGKYFVFLSNKDVFSVDLFLADANNGKVIKKLVSISKAGADHIDYLESAGSWSPNSKEYVYVIFKNGKNALAIADVESGKTGKAIFIKDVPALTNPSWSPDGKTIVFTGKNEGQVDLYSYNIKTKKTEQLTNDVYSEVGAKHNPDGSKLIFSYDKRSFNGETYDGMFTLDLAEIDLTTKTINILNVFHGADNVSPNYTNEGNIVFVSDPDGFRDMYEYDTGNKTVVKLTNVKTGISGITRYSPCITTARKSDKLLCSVYYDKAYSIVKSQLKNLKREEVDAIKVDKIGAQLPYKNPEAVHKVDENLQQQGAYAFDNKNKFKEVPYKAKFTLDYIGGSTGVGVNNNTFSSNTSLQGGIQTLFTDILGNNQLFANVALNGDFLDFATQTAYINRKHKVAWGASLGHIPLRTGYQDFADDRIIFRGDTVDVTRSDLNIIRLFNESLGFFAHYPFSTTLRAEAGVTGTYQHFRQDVLQEFYAVDQSNRIVLLGQDRMKVETADKIRFNDYYTLTKGFGFGANVALVGDNSVFGMTGPVGGHRFRIALENQLGIDNYFATLIDARGYMFTRPVTFAGRVLSYNRFEQETNTVYPFYVGQIGFVRGFSNINVDAFENPEVNINRMIGSKIGLLSGEARIPLFGPKQLALIKSKFLFTDLIAFADAGVTFNVFDQLQNGRQLEVLTVDKNGDAIFDEMGRPVYELKNGIKPLIAASAGISGRFNVFNIIIVEPYYARQLINNGRWAFGLNLLPGW